MKRNWYRFLRRMYAGLRLKLKQGLAQAGYFSRPSFLIIGVQKGGTVALHRYLAAHPYIVSGQRKEIGFFNKYYDRGEVWYHRHFPLPYALGQGRVTFEGTPEYLYHPTCAERISSYDPRMKLIALLRNPVERAYSGWNMFRHMVRHDPEYLYLRIRSSDEPTRKAISDLLTRESFPDFEGAVREEIEQASSPHAAPEPSYVRRGLYARQLRRYFQCFPREQVLVIDSRSLKDDTLSTLHQITQFLGLPAHEWRQETLPPLHVGQYAGRQMPEATRAYLSEFFEPHNQDLYELLGHDFGWS